MGKLNKLFVFEGPDGSGKTTLSRCFWEHLISVGINCEYFSFPSREVGTLGKHIYDLHHNYNYMGIESVNETALQLLHVASHVDTLASRILPAMRNNKWVVLDRYWWSTWVYGIVNGADKHAVQAMIDLEKACWGATTPSMIFVMKRAISSNTNENSKRDNLIRHYEMLVDIEKCNHPVVYVDNNVCVDDALSSIIKYANISNSRRNRTKPSEKTNKGRQQEFAFQLEKGNVNSPHVYTKLSPAKPTIVYDTYWRFAFERQEIFFAKYLRKQPPWTDDPILRNYKFTNVFRASDRVSQYLIKNVIYTGEQSPREITFRVILFKIFNKIETWELLRGKLGEISYAEYSFKRYDDILTKAMGNGKRIYSAAYIMPSGGPSSSSYGKKHRMHLRLLERMMKDDLPSRLADSQSMGKAFEIMKSYPTIGDFLAYQYITDINYSTLTNFSEMEFVIPGPGARDGIRKCFSDLGGLTEAEMIKVIADMQQVEFNRLGLKFQSLWGRYLQLIDCQNLFCEVDKYSRVRHPEITGLTGRTKIKQKYHINTDPIEYWYPPKWEINGRI